MQRTLSILILVLALLAGSSLAGQLTVGDSQASGLATGNCGLRDLPAPFLVNPLFTTQLTQKGQSSSGNCTDCFLACEEEFEQCFASCYGQGPGCRNDCIMQYSLCGDICMMTCLP